MGGLEEPSGHSRGSRAGKARGSTQLSSSETSRQSCEGSGENRGWGRRASGIGKKGSTCCRTRSMRPVPLLRCALMPARPAAGLLSRHPERQHSTQVLLPKPQATRAPSPHRHILSEPTREPPGRIPAHLLHGHHPDLSSRSRGSFCSPHRTCSARRRGLFGRSHCACAHPQGRPPTPRLHRERAWSQGTTQAGLGLPRLLAGWAGVASACLTSTLPHFSGKTWGECAGKTTRPSSPAGEGGHVTQSWPRTGTEVHAQRAVPVL